MHSAIQMQISDFEFVAYRAKPFIKLASNVHPCMNSGFNKSVWFFTSSPFDSFLLNMQFFNTVIGLCYFILLSLKSKVNPFLLQSFITHEVIYILASIGNDNIIPSLLLQMTSEFCIFNLMVSSILIAVSAWVPINLQDWISTTGVSVISNAA